MRTKIVQGSLAGILAGWMLGIVPTMPVQAQERLNWPSRILDTQRVGEVSPVVTGIAVRPGSNEAVIVGDDHVVHLVEINTGRLIQTLPGHEDWIRTIAFSPNGNTLLTAGSDRRILKWDLEQKRWGIFASENASIESIAFSPDGNWVAAVGFDSTLRIYDAKTGQKTTDLACPSGDLRAVAFSPDGQRLAAGGRSGQLLIWENRNQQWKSISQNSIHQQRIQGIGFANADQVISIGEDRLVHVTDLGSATGSGVIATMPSKLFSMVVLSPTLIACGGSDNRIHLIDLQEKKTIGYLDSHQGTISSLAFADGKLISGSYDGETRVWQAQAGITVAARDPNGLLSAPTASFDLPALEPNATQERTASRPESSPPLLPIRSVR
jgi:WD40 repeat protein